MPFYLVNKYGLPAHDHDVKELFGLDLKAKWPKKGLEARGIQGVLCWVKPAGALTSLTVPRRGAWPSGPRALCLCPFPCAFRRCPSVACVSTSNTATP